VSFRSDRGAAAVWVLGFSSVILTLALVAATRGSAVLARHRLAGTADLAALAAAHQIGRVEQPCAAAAWVATANAAVLVSCSAQLDASGRSGSVAVRLSRRVAFPLVGERTVSSRARAGRQPWQNQAGSVSRPSPSRSGGKLFSPFRL
jgi:secretion/DNA translocation related TadE-like protein